MPRKSREKITYLLLALVIFLADIISKKLVLKSFFLGQSIPIIKGIFHISLVANTGTAFGLFKNLAIFFTIFSALAIIIIFYLLFSSKEKSGLYCISLSLILAGACGNLLDRLLHGFIVDFLDFRIWPVFNLADSAITIGVALLVFRLIFDKQSNKIN